MNANLLISFDREKIRNSLHFNDDGLHQALLNIAYDEWQKHDNWDMEDMLDYARSFGDIVKLAVLLGKYNQQVQNGGHSQYFDNGYSGSHNYKGHTGDYYNYDIPLTLNMLNLMMKHGLNTTENGKAVVKIIEEFIDITSGWCREDDEEDEDNSMPDYSNLDTKYYKVCGGWMKDLEQYFKLWMEHNEDPIIAGRL